MVNTGDRRSRSARHFHFAEANPALAFDRAAARGLRLDIPAGTSVRFEPGVERRSTWCRSAAAARCTACSLDAARTGWTAT